MVGVWSVGRCTRGVVVAIDVAKLIDFAKLATVDTVTGIARWLWNSGSVHSLAESLSPGW